MITEIRQRTLNGELMSGTWCGLGSAITAEMAGNAGFDWVCLDLEHGSGGHETVVQQLQAAGATPAAPLVRVAWNEPPRFKRMLDLGCSGIMVPWVDTAEEAQRAVASMRYPPQGIRGAAGGIRATNFGWDFDDYFARANDILLTVVQIETTKALANCREIAAVDGIDVLFVGPLDLSTSLGIPGQFDHPKFRSAMATIVSACRQEHKAAGILLLDTDKLERYVSDGFTFIAVGVDLGIVANGLKQMISAFGKYKNK